MTPVKWSDLLQPDYVLVFGEAFLLAALPVLGLASAVTNGSVQPHAWPTGPSLLGAFLVGILNGVRTLHAYRSAPPVPKSNGASG